MSKSIYYKSCSVITWIKNLNCYYSLAASSGEKLEPSIVVASEDIVSKLAGMGFNYLHCQKAAINTANVGVEEAMTWLLSHMDDPGTEVYVPAPADWAIAKCWLGL